jgi:hypothetical protein
MWVISLQHHTGVKKPVKTHRFLYLRTQTKNHPHARAKNTHVKNPNTIKGITGTQIGSFNTDIVTKTTDIEIINTGIVIKNTGIEINDTAIGIKSTDIEINNTDNGITDVYFGFFNTGIGS